MIIRARGIQSVLSPWIKCATTSRGVQVSGPSSTRVHPSGSSASSAVSTAGVRSRTGIPSSRTKSIPEDTPCPLHQLLFPSRNPNPPGARMTARLYAVLAALAYLALDSVQTDAQQAPQVTAADYARAERFLRANVLPLVSGVGARPSWLEGDRFWYRSSAAAGSELIVVDPTRGLRSVCSPETGRCDAAIDDREASRVRAEFRRTSGGGRAEAISPDGKRAAFIRAWNLWVRDVATGRETQLTTDGVKDFGYATDNAGWIRSDNPILVWSPDSRKIATFQQDDRRVGEMYLVNTKVGHPELQAWKYPLPGDRVVRMLHRVILSVDAP